MAAFRMQTVARLFSKVNIGSLVTKQLRQASSAVDTFKFSDLEIRQTREPRDKPDPDTLVFGRQFADHMLEIDWTEQEGWGKPIIKPLENFSLHPASMVFHYAVELFEGMKAFRGVDNTVRIFRPDMNMTRMRNSAIRISLPDFEGDELIACLKKLVSIDKEWVPYSTKSTLYIRPTFIATDAHVGVSKPGAAKLFVITGPVGPYYPTGFNPISLLADPQYVRAWEGGVGAYKMGSNYGPTIFIQIEAMKKHNCQQVLWLYGQDHRVTEVGTMNFFMYWVNEQGDEELITPPLSSGLILPGVTRRSLIDLAQQWGEFKVTEKDFSMMDIVKGLKENRVKEIFGAGTACVVSPVSEIVYQGERLHIPTMDGGAPIVNRFWNELTDIQFGRKPSDWVVEIN